MRDIRKEDLSLYYYLKDIVLRSTVEEDLTTLRLLPETCSQGRYIYEYDYDDDVRYNTTGTGRGWVYFDDVLSGINCEPAIVVSGTNGEGAPAYGTPEQSNRVIVYEDGEVLDWREYIIDYVSGRIITNRELSNPEVQYSWNYVSVVDEWNVIPVVGTPIIAIDLYGTDKDGYQLGGGTKVDRSVDVHIFASNQAERNDLTDLIHNGLYNRSCPVYDFPTGSVLDADGTFYGRKKLVDRFPEGIPDDKLTYLFDRRRDISISNMRFEGVSSRHINLPDIVFRNRDEVMLSSVNRYRTKVSFRMVSLDDRIIT